MTDKHEMMTRGAKAEALLKNEILLGAFSALEAKYMQTWRSTTGVETDAREKLWLAYHILDDVKNHLARTVRDGKIAQQDIDRMAGLNRAA